MAAAVGAEPAAAADTNEPATTRTATRAASRRARARSEEHTSELQSLAYLVCRLLLEKKKDERIRDPVARLGPGTPRRARQPGGPGREPPTSTRRRRRDLDDPQARPAARGSHAIRLSI